MIKKYHVDGFPKSGNTFLKKYLEKSMSVEIKNATHSTRAIKKLINKEYEIFITVRDPLDSISSFIYTKNDINNPDIKTYTDYYERFYSEIIKIENNIKICIFADIVKDSSIFIKNIKNKKYISNKQVINEMAGDTYFKNFIPGHRNYDYYLTKEKIINSDKSFFYNCYELYEYLLIKYMTINSNINKIL